MIFNLPMLKDTMVFPSFPGKLLKVSGDPGERRFVYQITMDLDLNKCISNNALTIDIEVHKSKPSPLMERKPKKMGSARSFTRSTKTMEKSLRRSKKVLKEGLVQKSKVDVTKYLSNAQAALIKKPSRILAKSLGKLGKSSLKSGVTSGKSSNVPMSQGGGSTLLNVVSPIASPLASQPIPTTIAPKTIMPLQSIATAMVGSKKDPGQIAKIPLSSLPTAVGAKAQSIMFTPTSKSMLSPMYRILTRKKTITFRLVISEKRLKSGTTFYIKAILKNNKGVKLEDVGKIIQHSKLLNDFLTPTQPPLLEASIIKAGMISIGVKQVDKKAKIVRVFRRTAPAETGGSDPGSSWTEIIETPLLTTDDELRFKDEFATSRTVIYRALALGENMRPTEEFSSSLVLPIKELKVEQTTALSAVATSYRNGQAVKITVSDIPTDAISVMVRRYDVTNSSYADFQAGKSKGFTYVGDTPKKQSMYVVGDADGSVNFFDKRIRSGKEYRYVPVAIMKRGKQVIGTDALMEIPDAASDNDKVEMKTPTPVVIVKDNTPTVSFSLAASFTDFGFEEIQAVLSSQNQTDLFQQDVLSERSNFEDLISFLVERENFVTGEVESFGVIKIGDFEDNAESQATNNVAPLQTGIRYGYRLTALVRSAESLFPKLVIAETDPSTLARYRKQIGKFRNPLSLRKATLQSTARQTNISAPSRIEPIDPFLQGRTNVQKRIEVSVPVPKRPGYQVTTENRGENRLVRWTYFDNIGLVDHFQIFACYSGGRKLLGTVHADSASMKFAFRHFTEDYAVPYFYEVQAVRLDYKVRQKYRSAVIKPKKLEKQLKASSRSSKRIVRL